MPVDIARMYACGEPFAIYRYPGEAQVRVVGCGSEFYVNSWNTPSSANVAVHGCSRGMPECAPLTQSTPRDSYLAATAELIDVLKHRGGKCVRMRVICRDGVRVDVNAAVSELFERFPDAFCHCWYTPATGLWAGATPEVLVDCVGGRLRTMSLAGTRPAGTAAPWDAKNVAEQAFVTRYICEALAACGLEPECAPDATLRYGRIEHICTRIEAGFDSPHKLSDILDALSPTPAVAGMPRATAIQEIERFEDAPRRCYAGYVMTREPDGRVRAFVNLRCAQLSPEAWCVYAGGGITADSKENEEWEETAAKSAAWLEILTKHSLPK